MIFSVIWVYYAIEKIVFWFHGESTLLLEIGNTICSLYVVLQSILEKFEFFPIKCRIQRSFDIYKIAQEQLKGPKHKSIKLKVIYDCNSFNLD